MLKRLKENVKRYITMFEAKPSLIVCDKHPLYESNKLINIKDINSVNIRISNEITGVSNSIMSYIENKNVNYVYLYL